MIFLDANYWLRALVAPATHQDEARAAAAIALFQGIMHGTQEATTSEAILAEVAFVLGSPKHYGLTPFEITSRLRPIVSAASFKLPRKRRYLRTLDIWESHPRIGFVDALTAAYTEDSGDELATFDAHFDAISGITRYRP